MIEASSLDKILDSSELHQLMLRSDLSYFAEHILNMEIVGHHENWSHLTARHKRLALNAPRDHGKSFFFSFAYVIWRLYYNWIPSELVGFPSIPRISLGYIFSATQDQAINFLEIVKNEIETNPLLTHLIPDHRENWSKTEIKCANGSIVRARGWGVRVRGAHPVWVVCDDVLNDESIYSEVTRNKQIDYFFSAVTPMVVPGGQIIIIGTPFHQLDLYHKLAENPVYKFQKCAAIDEAGNALWPTRYDKASLELKKQEVGSTRFAREYLCVPISDESSLFPAHILEQCYDHEFEMPTHLTQKERDGLRIFTGVDLALSTTVGADFTVITTIGIDEYKNKWILDIRRKRGMPMSEQLREIQDVNTAFRPLKILIEDNAFQRVFRDELVRNTDLPVDGFTTTAHNKNKAERGVPSLQVQFENKKFVIARKTDRDRRMTDPLVNELKCFSWHDGRLQGLGAHDDCVLSLWIATEAASQYEFSFAFA